MTHYILCVQITIYGDCGVCRVVRRWCVGMVKVHCCSTTGGCGGTALIASQLTQTLLIAYWPLAIVYSALDPQMELLGKFIPLAICHSFTRSRHAISELKCI